jgi:two-component system, OmpR family, response regulator RegX3
MTGGHAPAMLPEDPIETSHDRPHGSAWLVLASEGPASALLDLSADVVLVASTERFVRVLLGERPRVAVVSVPPAGPDALASAVVERSRRPALRLVLLNDPDDIAGRLHALEQGFDDALPTTISPEELAGRISLLVSRPRQRPTGRLSVAVDTELDPVAHRIRRGGREVHLRPKEFALLALLATHPGRVFSRRELIDRVWGPDFEGDPRTVDVHVRWIRSKIEADADHPANLVTVRGTGYRLDPPGL